MKAIKVLLCLTLLCSCVGCVVLLRDDGEVGIKASHSISVFHMAKKNGAESRSELDLQPAVDYFVELKGDDDAEEPSAVGADTVEVTVVPDGG